MSGRKLWLLVGGILIVLAAVVVGFLGGLMVWLENANVDSEGFYMTDPMQVDAEGSYALICSASLLEDKAVEQLKWANVETLKLEG